MQETQEMWVPSLSQEDPLEEEIVQYPCLGNPKTEKPVELQSMGSQRVRHSE